MRKPVPTSHADGRTCQLQRIWFSVREIQALAVFKRLVDELDPGLLDEHLAPLARHVEDLIQHERLGLDETERRVRLSAWGTRRSPRQPFAAN